jgi:hypothetical protein
MDLTQSKLSRAEWNSIEVPVSEDELFVLKMINEGATNVNVRTNRHLSLIQFIKLEQTAANEAYLFEIYFQKILIDIVDRYKQVSNVPDENILFTIPIMKTKDLKALKRADSIRVENMDISTSRCKIFEYILIDFCEHLLDKLAISEPTYVKPAEKKSKHKTSVGTIRPTKLSELNEVPGNHHYIYYLYTLMQLQTYSIQNGNPYVISFVKSVIEYASSKASVMDIVQRAHAVIEQNPYLLKYEDISLYSHQKELFSIFSHRRTPKLVLYMAPTGTGKTMSPIGLSNNYRVIFVCVARHVGLALAKSAISVNKRIAFAFGCDTASDIRLHYFAATDYVINKRSGGIGKVDNSVGDKVEIIICDVKSYLIAMQYMLAFNRESQIITYWDEPTITMDYENHELHETIHRNWAENRISKMVLSCATLPKQHEIASTIMDFQYKFEGADIHTIQSYDCKKSISILSKDGNPVIPHLLFSTYEKLQECATHCNENKSLLRYFDLKEIVRFIMYVNETPDAIDEAYKMQYYFEDDIRKVTMNEIKIYYLMLLNKINPEKWTMIYNYLSLPQIPTMGDALRPTKSMETPHVSSTTIFRQSSVSLDTPKKPLINANHAGILLTTADAHTLTDGPTIYLAEDIQKMGAFFIHQTKMPERVYTTMMDRIEKNTVMQKRLDILEKTMEDKLGKDMEKSKKMEREAFSGELRTLKKDIDELRSQIQVVTMDKTYLPNTPQHQRIWTTTDNPIPNAFVPSIDEPTIKKIMMLNVDTNKKMLLILGIGMFDSATEPQYMEIMKGLAMEQKLFIIIASSDYIYGTNYQFCHGFIGKDLQNMTQQKIIQAMGRIGRNKIQQEYSIRFRDDTVMASIFLPPQHNREAEIMSELFSS